jgi:hypothetical protein
MKAFDEPLSAHAKRAGLILLFVGEVGLMARNTIPAFFNRRSTERRVVAGAGLTLEHRDEHS